MRGLGRALRVAVAKQAADDVDGLEHLERPALLLERAGELALKVVLGQQSGHALTRRGVLTAGGQLSDLLNGSL